MKHELAKENVAIGGKSVTRENVFQSGKAQTKQRVGSWARPRAEAETSEEVQSTE